MKNSSEADILAVVESAKRAASNLMRTGRVWEYSLLSRIMKSPDPIGRMIEELQSRGNAVVGIPTKDPAPAVPAKTHWSLPVHLRRSCMRTSSEADILAVVESAKRAVSNLMRTGRVWEYSLLSRIMQSPDTIGRMIEELESRGNAVVGIPTEAPTAAVPAVPDVPVEAPAESSSESSGELYQCPDTTKQGTSLRERMASLGYYKKHSLDHDLLVSFAKFLQFDMSNENFKQEVENVARFLYFMDPQQASLLFVRQHEKSREYFLKLSEAGLSKQTVQNYIKSVKRFLKFHTGSTDLCFTDRVLHEDCKNYISFLDNIQMATSKQVSKETTRKRFDTFQEGVLSSTQVTAVLAAAKKDFLAVIGKLHAGECSPGHQLTLTELQLVLYYLEAIVILEHAQWPGVVEHMTVTEWISRRRDDTRPGFVVVAVKEHKTAATFVLTQEQEMWFDLYFSEVRPVMLGKKRKRVEDDDETDERFFISSTDKAIYNASNDLERLHKKYQVPKVTSQMARRAYETATKELSDVQKTKVAGYLTHSTATAEKHYRMKEIGSAVDAFLRNLRGDSDSDQSDTPRGSSAYLTDQAAYDKLLRSYPVTLDGVPPNRSRRRCPGGTTWRWGPPYVESARLRPGAHSGLRDGRSHCSSWTYTVAYGSLRDFYMFLFIEFLGTKTVALVPKSWGKHDVRILKSCNKLFQRFQLEVIQLQYPGSPLLQGCTNLSGRGRGQEQRVFPALQGMCYPRLKEDAGGRIHALFKGAHQSREGTST
ncbi:hypothetical protein SRHO_G00340400 [Serrasalmus rhombeus]